MARTMTFIEYADFWRKEAIRQGLIQPYWTPTPDKGIFTLDLNQGTVKVASDPQTIARVIVLAEDEGNAILQLVARVDAFNDEDGNVYWNRPYHVAFREYPDMYMTMKDWLASHGLIVEYVR